MVQTDNICQQRSSFVQLEVTDVYVLSEIQLKWLIAYLHLQIYSDKNEFKFVDYAYPRPEYLIFLTQVTNIFENSRYI